MKQACKVLHITQPTLSDQLRTLEESLGVQLFDRKNRRLVLNNMGEKVLKYANRIFSLGNELLRVVTEEKSEEKRTTVEIGIVPYLSKAFTFELLLPIFQVNRFKVRLQEGELKHLIADLNLGNIELIITNSKIPNREQTFVSTKICETRFFAVGGGKMDHAVDKFPHSLHDLPFFHYTKDNPQRDDIDQFFANAGIKPQIVGEADDINFLKLATANNICFSILPEASVRDFSKVRKLTVLGEIKELRSSVWAVTNSEMENEYVYEFVKQLVCHSELMNMQLSQPVNPSQAEATL